MFVILGLDPRIWCDRVKGYQLPADPRVKPGDDGEKQEKPAWAAPRSLD
jgi:hypothetical protein